MSTYRGWRISYDPPPIPVRSCDWSAAHPDYDGAEDANDNRYFHGPTGSDVRAQVDDWIAENAPVFRPEHENTVRDGMSGEFGYAFLIGVLDVALIEDGDGLERAREYMRIWRDVQREKAK